GAGSGLDGLHELHHARVARVGRLDLPVEEEGEGETSDGAQPGEIGDGVHVRRGSLGRRMDSEVRRRHSPAGGTLVTPFASDQSHGREHPQLRAVADTRRRPPPIGGGHQGSRRAGQPRVRKQKKRSSKNSKAKNTTVKTTIARTSPKTKTRLKSGLSYFRCRKYPITMANLAIIIEKSNTTSAVVLGCDPKMSSQK